MFTVGVPNCLCEKVKYGCNFGWHRGMVYLRKPHRECLFMVFVIALVGPTHSHAHTRLFVINSYQTVSYLFGEFILCDINQVSLSAVATRYLQSVTHRSCSHFLVFTNVLDNFSLVCLGAFSWRKYSRVCCFGQVFPFSYVAGYSKPPPSGYGQQTNYGQPSGGYAASGGYQAASYGQPSSSYGQTSSSYGQPSSSYGQPPSTSGYAQSAQTGYQQPPHSQNGYQPQYSANTGTVFVAKAESHDNSFCPTGTTQIRIPHMHNT